jgi:2-polyprenyl-6-methoxyphenol hydroxylase-like FAD-dependent oxidoreductase
MVALVLRSVGYSVHVLERSSPETLQSQAAGIRAGPELHSFIETYVRDFDPNYAIAPDLFEIMKKSGEVELAIPPADPLRLTTWKRVYDMLKEALRVDEKGAETAVYETRMKVEDVKDEGEKVSVTYRILDNDTTKTLEADLVIAADGAQSTVRKIVSDNVIAPKYAGYVTWRGRVPEEILSAETREALQKRCVLMRVQNGYMIS